MEKLKYTEAELEVVSFEAEDVITTSDEEVVDITEPTNDAW